MTNLVKLGSPKLKRIEKEKKCGEKSDLGIAIKKKADKGEKERERERKGKGRECRNISWIYSANKKCH